MLIPLGHEDQTVRRLPWVTFAILALNLVLFLTVGRSAGQAERYIYSTFEEAASYWFEHPYLELEPEVRAELEARMGTERFEVLAAAMDSSLNPRPEDDLVVEHEQETLNRLMWAYISAQDRHPYGRWGLIPNKVTLLALLTSMFMHAGWLHLLGNMFILYLAGPSVEDAYGRPLYLVFYLASGAASAGAHIAAFPDSGVALIGASGAIAGVMGAFLIRFSRTRIKFFYWIGLFFRGTFSAPAWAMLPLWLVEQLWLGSLTKSEGGVAYWAHVGGFVFGAVVAYAIKAAGVEEKYIHPRIEAEISLTQHPALERGMELLSHQNFIDARVAFEEVLAAEPRNPDANLGMWESYVQEERAADGRAYLGRVIEAELRAGDLTLAFDHWREGSNAGAVVAPALRFRLASQLASEHPTDAVEVFRSVAHDPAAGLLASKAATRLADLAPTDLERDHWRDEAARLEAEVSGTGVGAVPTATGSAAAPGPAGPVPPTPPAPSPPEPAATDPEPAQQVATPAAAASGPAPPPAAPRIERRLLRRLHPSGLLVSGDQEEVIRYETITAVTMAGVRGAGKAYLVTDLVLRPDSDGARRVVRLLSSEFDPRAIMERVDLKPIDAYRALIQLISTAGHARVLPDHRVLEGGSVPVFTTLAEYERSVLGLPR